MANREVEILILTHKGMIYCEKCVEEECPNSDDRPKEISAQIYCDYCGAKRIPYPRHKEE